MGKDNERVSPFIFQFAVRTFRTKTKIWRPHTSVTRFGDLLDFGQLFKAFGTN